MQYEETEFAEKKTNKQTIGILLPKISMTFYYHLSHMEISAYENWK